MKNFILLITCLFILSSDLQSQTWPGPVGIGTTQPRDLFHIKDGSMILEGADRYINFMTKYRSKSGLKFITYDGLVKGTWRYSSEDETINLSSDGELLGLVYNFKNNFALLGRNDQIGANEKFGLRINTPKLDFGGMNIETFGHRGSKPYYGYAINGDQEAIHYYDGESKTWKLKVGTDIMAATSDGNVGIGTNSPVSKLHVHGTSSNLAQEEGILTLGNTTHRLALGMTTSGSDTGYGRIYSKSNSGKLILGGNSNDVLSIMGNSKKVGINTNFPNYTFEVISQDIQAVSVINNSSISSVKIGAKFISTSEGNALKYGIISLAQASDSQSDDIYGGKIEGVGGLGSGKVYGLLTRASGTGTGDNYGIYTQATTSNPSPTTKSWALYSYGNSYFSEKVFIGDENGALGYKLSVDGKIICEDLRMEPSASWPDYVFEKNYDLKPLKEVEAFVEENNHLPGVPSAQEIEDQGGYEQGEMNRILLEKVEELTLYLIDQKKVLDKQNEKIVALEEALKKQSEK